MEGYEAVKKAATEAAKEWVDRHSFMWLLAVGYSAKPLGFEQQLQAKHRKEG